MNKIFKTAIFTVAIMLSVNFAFGQELLTIAASPFHQAKVTLTIPDNIPAGTVISVNATWYTLYATTPPTASASVTVKDGVKDYTVTFLCLTDDRPKSIYLCAKINKVPPLYSSGEYQINQSSTTTNISMFTWTGTGCTCSSQ